MHRSLATTGCLTLAAMVALAGCGSSLREVREDLHTPWQAWHSTTTFPLSGASEVPPVSTTGGGSVLAHLEPASRVLRWTVTYSGLGGPVTAAHFHGPALPGENAPAVLPLHGNLSSPIQGTAVLTPEQAADFLAGKWYINLHTAAHPGGELRAQIPAKP